MQPRPTTTPPHTSGNTSGVGHWWVQRLTAVALIPLTLWFMFALIGRLDDGYAAVHAWVATPVIAIAIALYLASMLIHARLGMQVVLEDYVHGARRLRIALWVVDGVMTLAALIAGAAILCIVLS